ncbi:DODA-type extradiol aromatic ring-opening family dioxygenase [Caldiplasma sukawensis]
MTIENIFVIPHGDEILTRPNNESEIMFSSIREKTKNDRSEVILIISPHSVRLNNGIGIVHTENVSCYYEMDNFILKESRKVERKLAEKLSENFREGVLIDFVTSSGELSDFPEDFGSAIPLYFFKGRSVVIIGQPRISDRNLLIRFGQILHNVAENYGKKVTVIFSADQAHTHSKTGPYGYSPEADEYDNMIQEFFEKNKVYKIREVKDEIIEKAKPDSYWNMVILSGLMEGNNYVSKKVYYYMEKYFGMMFCTIEKSL